ncbi:MAG: O-antigen ligase family protein [Sedimentisphaerales bacterium]
MIFEYVLLGLCLCVIALRSTFTESPTTRSATLPGNIGDIVYSLSVSAVLIFSVIFWFVWSSRNNRFIYRFTGIEFGLCLFGLSAIVAGFAAADKRLAITHVVMLLAPPLMAVLLVQILDSPARIKLVLAVIAALGVVSAYQCAEQFFFSNQMMIEQYEQDPETLLEPLGIESGTFAQFLFEHRLYTRGVRGFFTTRNSAGSFALMASFAAIALFIDKLKNRDEGKPHVKRGAKYLAPPFRRGYSNLACGAAVAIVIFGLILTKSRGAILGSLFAAGLFIAYICFGNQLKAHKKTILIVCLLLLIAGGWLVIWYGLKHHRLPGGSGMLVRWQYWYASAKMYVDHPLTGVGPGNFTHFYPHYKPAEALESVADPHNFLLSILTQYGPLGLAGLLAMIFIPLWRVIFSASVSSVRLGGSLKAEGFGDGGCGQSHPQAALEAATRRREPGFRTLAIIFLIVISAALLLIRPMIMPAVPADTLDVIIYVILTLYVAPVAVFFIGFLLLTAPLKTIRDTQYAIRDTRTVAILFCAVLGVLLHNLIDFAIFEPGVFTTFWAIIACIIANRDTQYAIRNTRYVIIAAGVLILIVFVRHAWWPVYKSTTKIRQAQQTFSLGRLAHAHDLLSAAAEADRLDPTALNLNGRLYLQHYSQTVRKDSTGAEIQSEAHVKRGTKYLAPGFTGALLRKAEKCFLQAIQRNQADFKNYEKLSTVYELLGQTKEAYDWCLKATQLYPGSGRLRFKLAQIAEQLGKSETAMEQYKKAVEIEDKYRHQFKIIYPQRQEIVSRLGEEKYQFAKKRQQLLRRKR